MNEKNARKAVNELARERPDWIPVLQAALVVAERCEPYGGEFAGAWVLEELAERMGRSTWLPNLRLLTSYGLLTKVGDSTRGGRRAYYRCTDRRAISAVVEELMHQTQPTPVPATKPVKKFAFIGSGDSGKSDSDVARRAGDITYEPRSWR
jgi:hypothetical protein